VPQTIFCLFEGSIWQEENTMWREAERTLWHWLLHRLHCSKTFICSFCEGLTVNCSWFKASDRSWVFACEFSVSVIQKYLPQMYLLVYRRNNNDIFNFSALSCGFLAVFVSWRWVAEFSEHCSLVGTWCRKTAKQRKRKNMRILMDEKNCQRKL